MRCIVDTIVNRVLNCTQNYFFCMEIRIYLPEEVDFYIHFYISAEYPLRKSERGVICG